MVLARCLKRATVSFVAAVACVIWLSLPSPVQATAKPSGPAWTTGPWNGNTYRDETTGAFTHCQMYARFAQSALIFSINRQRHLHIGLSNKSWQLPTDQRYSLTLSVDGHTLGSFDAKPINGRTIVIPITRNADGIIKALKQGNTLLIVAAKETFQYRLVGTNQAFDRLIACVKSHLEAGGDDSNPFAGGNVGTTTDTTNDLKVKSRKLIANVLQKIHDKRYRLLNPIPDKLKTLKADAVWTAPGGFGALNVLPGNYPAEKLKEALAAQDAKNCLGEFRAASQTRYLVGKVKSPVIKVACTRSKSGNPFFINYAFYPASNHSSLRITHYSREPEGSNEADQRFFQEIEKLVKIKHSN